MRYISLFVLFLYSFGVQAEGTAQWMPFGMAAGQELSVMLYNDDDGNGRLGTTGCDSLERIHIAVSSNFANERIYIGMNVFNNTDSYFRVMAPNGTQVYPASAGTLQAVLSSGGGETGEGYIASLNQARNGPIEVHGAGGYDAISITPTMAGNYYIEFNGANSTTFTDEGRHQISYFDVTVALTNGLAEGSGNHTAIDGRLHSYQWGMYNLTDGLGFNTIDAEYFVYQSQDSIVTKIIWDEVKPGGFDILFTNSGLTETGDLFADRQSKPYSSVAPGSFDGDYPIFVNDPDSTLFPSSEIAPLLTFFDYERCAGSTCFLYEITKGGQVEVLLDFNENGEFDPGTEDILLVDNQPAGLYCLDWNNEDGLGNFIFSGQAQTVVKYQAGIIHMPLGDVEDNPNGFSRELIRPNLAGTTNGKIYFDHSVVGGAFNANDYDYEGCESGCNVWDNDDGNQLYLNTWLSYAELRDTLFTVFDGCDGDGDGLSDDLDIDDDNDGIPDIAEFYIGDHDNDGIRDFEDGDFCAAVLSGVSGWDCADGLPDPSGDIDGDGVINASDVDFPGCGILVNSACSGYDSDGDGNQDFIDLDSDNDGIPDLVEAGGVDTDGNGKIDVNTDIDLDGLWDAYDNDVTDGTNGSGPCTPIPGCLGVTSTSSLLDTDGNGVSDNLTDTDNDGLPDWLDLDSDNDGIPDLVEAGGTDIDGDGRVDITTDADLDGFRDLYDPEICRDTNSNGVATYFPGASTGIPDGGNASGFADQIAASVHQESDLLVLDFGVELPVGTPYVLSWRRKSSYTFGPTANMEVEESTSSAAGYSFNSVSPQTTSITNFARDTLATESVTRFLRISIATNSDDDMDFDAVKFLLDDTLCITPGNPLILTGADNNADGFPDSYMAFDTDGDDVLDHLDLDSDNDGIPDVVEAGGTDTDGDGYFDDQTDADGDGLADDVDGDVGNDGTAENSANALQVTGADTDNDGVPNSYPNDDTDNDGIRNQLDLDSDNDGIVDVVEAGGVADANGRLNGATTDTDNDGFGDGVDGDVGNDGTAENTANALTATGADNDNDGAPNSFPNDDVDGDDLYNFYDIDADGDGIIDNVEAQVTSGTTEPGGSDGDGDGLDNNFEAAGLTPVDTDSDGTPDYLDLDSDNDGYSDAIEGWDTDGDNIADTSPTSTDTDNDGLDEGYDDVAGPNNTTNPSNGGDDGIDFPNVDDATSAERDWRELQDYDKDGIADIIDIDDDNDGIPDTDENAGCSAAPDQSLNFQVYDGVPSGNTVDNIPYTGLLGTGAASSIDVSALQNTFDPGDADNFSIRYTGYITISTSETYTFYTNSDDGSKLFVNGVQVVDNDGDHGLQEESGTIALTPGTYAFTLLFYDNTGSAILTASYSSASITKTIIPFTVLSARNECDNDGDGIPNQFDLDADNDGIPDLVEAGGVDTDGDGQIDGALADTDGDGLLNTYDTDNGGDDITNADTDGDGINDFLDLDSDNDGIPDVVEAGGTDTDGDGIFDDQTDTDGDGFADDVDGDVGNDGTAENSGDALQLTGTDTDNDGAPDGFPDDDADGDGIRDQLDLDADNDGIPDVVEAGGTDTDGDGIFDDLTDTDGDGFADDVDGDVGNDGTAENSGDALQLTGADTDDDGAPNSYPNDDTDGDGVRDQLDLDADNDGIPDVVEAGGTDENGDGRADNYADSDGDGFNDDLDGDVGNDGTAENTAQALQTTGADTDNDGEPNSYPNDDFDGDGIRNQLDLDSDDDGILDVTEAGGADTNRDGQEDGATDNDGDGFNDAVDGDTDNSLTAGDDSDDDNIANVTTATGPDANNDGVPDSYPNDDFDGDGNLNYLDIDADNDGIVDNTEGQSTAGYVAPANADADGDGIDNAYDSDDAAFGGANSSFVLSDIDAGDDPDSPDYLDLDSDNDGIVDIIEGHDSDGDGVADASSPASTGVSGGTTDADGDGLYDGWDNNTSSVDPTNSGLQGTSHPNVSGPLTTERDWRELVDSDNDGISDVFDLDDDNDGILDIDETNCTDGFAEAVTLDQGVVSEDNALGIPNGTEGVIGSGDILTLDLIDIVPEGTQILLRLRRSGSARILVEGSVDNGGSTYTNPTRYGNTGTIDVTIVPSNTLVNVFYTVGAGGARFIRFTREAGTLRLDAIMHYTSACPVVDTDGDGVPDQLDLDADNDGIPDIVEAGGADTDGDGRIDGFVDTDEDGLGDTYDSSNGGDDITNPDTDGDGIEDYLDLDADNDGIPDVVEAGGTDEDGDGRFDDQTDTDGDGFADDVDGDVGNDGTPENSGDALQITGTDTDADGVPNSYPNDDTDGDGIRDQLDLDADNDGIPDVVEAGGTDTNGDGIFDDLTDTDGDGFADDVDGDVGNDGTAENSGDALQLTGTDTDDDGAPNSYPNDDTDGDGVRDQLDLDSDNDGIPDVVEAGGTDTDGDGIFDDQTDTDGDGLADDVDGDVGNDGTAENSGDALQLTGADTDDDGEPNSYPNDDTDGDGVRDQLDLDSDNDGIPDVVEAGGTDEDGDGIFDDLTDTDGDGFADDVDGDVGNDGTAENSGDALQLTGADTDNDGAPNSYPNDDTDGDGIRDQLDLDADNDGIPDVVEAGGTDEDGDGIFDDLTDTDGDGFADVVDGDVGNDGTAENTSQALQTTGADTDNDGAPNSYPNDDTDGDGLRDQLDLDADGDGIPDVVEAGGTDEDGDGFFDDLTDTDGDGFADDVDGDVGNDGTAENTDQALQITGEDTDDDGAPNSFPSDDFDGDGIPNQLDIDSDDDGITDVIEAGGTDADEDGREDGTGADIDNDGLDDGVDGDVGNDGTAENTANAQQVTGADTDNDGAPNSYPADDSDGDGLRDQVDIDADNDGITDNTEGQSTAGYAAPSGVDTDGDGLDDSYDPDCAPCGGVTGAYVNPEDTDGTGSPDYLDLDSDDDGEADSIEGHDSDGDGVADSGSPSDTGLPGGSTDDDGDGLLDGYDNNTASRDPTNSGVNPSSHPDVDEGESERDWREVPCAGGDITLAPNNATTTANDFCEESGFTYYYNPSDPTELLFAIEHKPVGGNSNDFTVSIDITVSANPTTSGGVFSAENIGAGEATFVMGRYYNISITSGSLNGNVNVRFYYDADESAALAATADDWNTDNAGGTSNVSGLRWFTMNSGTFDPESPDLQSTGIQGSSEAIPTATSTEDGVAFSQFSLSSLTGGGLAYTVGINSVVLPVEWFSFNAQKEEDIVHLHWVTATEKNTDVFNVERSTPEDEEWKTIARVNAAGQSQELLSYDSYDLSPENGLNYYRIKQIDLDQSFDYSQVRSVLFVPSQSTSIMVYPNPNNGSFTVQMSNPEAVQKVVLLSASGQVVRVWDGKAFGEGSLRVEGIGAGTYTLQVVTASEVQSLRIVVN